jgi:hypothetical protein
MSKVLSLTAHALLIQDDAGVFSVDYEGINYLLADLVLDHIMEGNTQKLPPGLSAGDFVTSCMIEKFRPDTEHRAHMACRFLFADYRNATA